MFQSFIKRSYLIVRNLKLLTPRKYLNEYREVDEETTASPIAITYSAAKSFPKCLFENFRQRKLSSYGNYTISTLWHLIKDVEV